MDLRAAWIVVLASACTPVEQPPPPARAAVAEVVDVQPAVVDVEPSLQVGPAFLDRIHPCGARRRMPRRVCVVIDEVEPAARFLPQLRRLALRRRADDDTFTFELRPRELETATDGILRDEVEHSTAGVNDCVWRLRGRDDTHLLDTLPIELCK